jgi:hypothetical protein
MIIVAVLTLVVWWNECTASGCIGVHTMAKREPELPRGSAVAGVSTSAAPEALQESTQNSSTANAPPTISLSTFAKSTGFPAPPAAACVVGALPKSPAKRGIFSAACSAIRLAAFGIVGRKKKETK